MPPHVTTILHAQTWPPPAALEALKHRLREAFPEAEVLESRENLSLIHI